MVKTRDNFVIVDPTPSVAPHEKIIFPPKNWYKAGIMKPGFLVLANPIRVYRAKAQKNMAIKV
jgi:hypothetical protein